MAWSHKYGESPNTNGHKQPWGTESEHFWTLTEHNYTLTETQHRK